MRMGPICLIIFTLTIAKVSGSFYSVPNLPQVLDTSPPCGPGQYRWVNPNWDEMETKCKTATQCHPPLHQIRDVQPFEDRVCCPKVTDVPIFDGEKFVCTPFANANIPAGRTWFALIPEYLETGPMDGHFRGVNRECIKCDKPLVYGMRCKPYKQAVCCKAKGSIAITVNTRDACLLPSSPYYPFYQRLQQEEYNGTDVDRDGGGTGSIPTSSASLLLLQVVVVFILTKIVATAEGRQP